MGQQDASASSPSRMHSGAAHGGFERLTRHSLQDEAELVYASTRRLRVRKRHAKTGTGVAAGGQETLPDDRDPAYRKLTPEQKERLLHDVLGDDSANGQAALAKIAERFAKAGVEVSRVEVRFQDLTVSTQVLVGDRAMPTISNAARSSAEVFLKPLGVAKGDKRPFTILSNVSGVLRPGRAVLLLGPPGSGKTTLLRALAGKIQDGPVFKVSGSVLYSGCGFDQFIAERTAGYVEQIDTHLAPLTVRETFNFAARCQGLGHREEELRQLQEKEAAANMPPDPTVESVMKANATYDRRHIFITDLMLRLLGLDVCADTVVGDEMMRGISGGQRKRVTTGEIIVGPRKTLLMDEISTGLDSATTFSISKSLVNFAHHMQGTIMVALLQPPPETFQLFDDIMLLAQGQVVYFGPREEVMPFFQGLGFYCPPRKGIADFLQDVTLPKEQPRYRTDPAAGAKFLPIADIAAAYRASGPGLAMAAALAAPQPSDGGAGGKGALVTRRFALPWHEMLRVNMWRSTILFKRLSIIFYSRTVQVLILAFMTATLFIHPGTGNLAAGSKFLQVVFIAALVSIFAGFSKVPETVSQLGVFYKQREDLFYPAWAYAVPQFIIHIPFAAYEAVLWIVITYWSVGFAPDAGRFFIQVLVLTLTTMVSAALFRLCAAVGREITIATTVGAVALFTVILTGGTLLSKSFVPAWWVWAYWASPVAFAVRAMSINEMSASRWQKPWEANPQVTLGYAVLDQNGWQTEHIWVWIGVCALAGYVLILNVLTTLAFTYLSAPGGMPTLPEEALNQDAGAGEGANAGAGAQPAKPAAAELPPASVKIAVAPAPASPAMEVVPASPAAPRGATPPTSFRVESAAPLEGQAASSPKAPAGFDIDQVESGGMGEAGKPGGGKSALPYPKLVMAFRDVHYYVPLPAGAPAPEGGGNELELLKGISGSFRPGVLTALMGSSGAGKTTLMDVLAGRKTGGRITGDIYVNGHPKDPITLARVMGYVEQGDTHSPRATVAEALAFSASLRVTHTMDAPAMRAYVAETMELVGLTPLANAMIGLPGQSGLSVEQRKRLTIAVELVANPSIIFMDEPTSGLDARAAAIVMRSVRNTVSTGRTVVCTIHQPSIDIFEAFDELLLLQRGGTTLYAGPLGYDCRDLISYFEGLGLRPLPDGYNPATWMLELTTPAAEEASGKSFTDIYANSELKKQVEEQVEAQLQPADGLERLHFDNLYARSKFAQYKALLGKFSTAYWRTPEYNWVRLLVTILLGFMIGTLYWKKGQKTSTQAGVQTVLGAANAATIFLGSFYSLNVQPVVSVERTVFYRERAAQMYAALPYALAQGTVELPYLAMQSVIYASITYWCIDFIHDAGKFFWFLAFMYLTLDFFTHLGIMNVCLMPNLPAATILSTTMFSIMNLFSGFFIARPDIRGCWIWLYWINPLAYSTYGLVASQLGDVDSTMSITDGGTTTVSAFLDTAMGFKHSFIGWCLFILIGYTAVFRLVAAIALKKLNFQVR